MVNFDVFFVTLLDEDQTWEGKLAPVVNAVSNRDMTKNDDPVVSRFAVETGFAEFFEYLRGPECRLLERLDWCFVGA